jgi:diketogulonate reductase-like aldo/keto reductase
MATEPPTYLLSNGVRIPCIGYGTAPAPEDRLSDASGPVLAALEAGYRHIDTAQMYENESGVGRAVAESGIPRSGLFLTSKLHNQNHGYESTMRSFERSLRALKTDYLDLFLIHWPNPVAFREDWRRANSECWRAMEALYRQRAVRAIGVSNFRPHHFEALLETADVQPMVNQIRLFPGDSSIHAPTLDWCARRGILLEAYSPLGLGGALSQPLVVQLAEAYGRTPAQICLRWSVQMGYLPLPKTVKPARMRENLDIWEFSIGQEDMSRLSAMPPSMADDRDPDQAWW